jgi:type I restriction enzyme M protein
MLNKETLKNFLIDINFIEKGNVLERYFKTYDCYVRVDFNAETIIYPEEKGLHIIRYSTCSFEKNENFVELDCICRLLEKGYDPAHITLEPKFKVGHGASGGWADIMVSDNAGKTLMIIECKTSGEEYEKEWKKMQYDGGQLFSYAQQKRAVKYLCLYTTDYNESARTVVYSNKIISLIDNKEYLKTIQNPKAYSDAADDVQQLYAAWTETYHQSYDTVGIFEDKIEPYHIGKSKISIDDLKEFGKEDIRTKYNEFATILRQHNIAGHENAFDKLVNLFLTKIVDETINSKDLQFYWKGIAFDDYFSLQDRIQKLYKIGMEKFLGEKVTYIDNQEIKSAFRLFKNDPDATKETILEYFRQLKFFTNNDFAFLDVHNESLFYQNMEVLLKIIKMLQDFRLTSEEENQFLGDLFEGFLDSGVKQSEGQFFTPIPIVKFIVSSLPIEEINKEEGKFPKVIDYACGAGHFLNEYAMQIKKCTGTENFQDYCSNIVGIEKEYRLSKVAKVSAFMYGQDNIQIYYADTLAKNYKIANGTFDILISNPPYSVKGFLETLTEEERTEYTLTNYIDSKSYSTNNSVETYFMEKAEHLLKPGGYMAVIFPSTVLEKVNAVYQRMREILIENFEILSLVSFGSGVFGKTGTKTVVIFARKREECPKLYIHVKNRVDSWFAGNYEKDTIFEDTNYMESYCKFMGYDYLAYKQLLENKFTEEIVNDMWEEYEDLFEKQTEINKLKRNDTFKKKKKEQQKEELLRLKVSFIKHIEKEKLKTYILARNNRKVLVIHSPTNKQGKTDKKFIGYEWSDAKGKEGIHYIGAKIEEDSFISMNQGIHVLTTPLVNPKNYNDPSKINYFIRKNFQNETLELSNEMKEYMSYESLEHMIDFESAVFNKKISVLSKEKYIVRSEYPIVKLGLICHSVTDGSHNPPVGVDQSNYMMLSSRNIIDGKINYDQARYLSKSDFEKEDKRTQVREKDVLLTIVGAIGRTAVAPKDMKHITFQRSVAVLKPNNNKVDSFYLKYYLEAINEVILMEAHGLAQKGIYLNQIKRLKIVLPEKDTVQVDIIKKCKAIEKEYSNTKMNYERYLEEIKNIFVKEKIMSLQKR